MTVISMVSLTKGTLWGQHQGSPALDAFGTRLHALYQAHVLFPIIKELDFIL